MAQTVETGLSSGPELPIERLLAERVALCWVAASDADAEYTRKLKEGMSFREGEYYSKRCEQTNRQLLKAIDAGSSAPPAHAHADQHRPEPDQCGVASAQPRHSANEESEHSRSAELIEAVAAAAKTHGAASFGSAVLRLAPQVKVHYLAFVSETFPDLLPRYERAYAGTNISSDYQTAIERRVAQVRGRQGFSDDAMQGRWTDARTSVRTAEPVLGKTGQLALPL
jgi:hypothetical protein